MSAGRAPSPDEAAAWEQQRLQTVTDWAARSEIQDLIRPAAKRAPGGFPDYPAYWRHRAAERRRDAASEEARDPDLAARYRQDADDWEALAARGTAYLKGW